MKEYIPKPVKAVLRPVKRWIMARKNRRENGPAIKRLLEKDRLFIELGSGGRVLDGWNSLDLANAEVCWDLAAGPLPFPNGSVDGFYSSHLFEHFSYPEPMLSILEECLRCLKEGGLFSIAVPNAALYLDGYASGEYPKQAAEDPYLPAMHGNSRVDIVNYIAYMGGEHKHLFDQEGLVEILKKAGFKNAQAREYDAGIDRAVRRWESIYAIAYK